jgi:SnoaL-like domain
MKLNEKFIAALNKLESTGEIEPIVALFTDQCEVSNVLNFDESRGVSRARDFWSHYRDTFDEVHSRFRNQIISDNRIALEWITEGSNKDGGKVTYEGVSILETDKEKITRFFAYFDAKKLGQQIGGEYKVK